MNVMMNVGYTGRLNFLLYGFCLFYRHVLIYFNGGLHVAFV